MESGTGAGVRAGADEVPPVLVGTGAGGVGLAGAVTLASSRSGRAAPSAFISTPSIWSITHRILVHAVSSTPSSRIVTARTFPSGGMRLSAPILSSVFGSISRSLGFCGAASIRRWLRGEGGTRALVFGDLGTLIGSAVEADAAGVSDAFIPVEGGKTASSYAFE